MTHLIYVADPMCSWCYGFGPQLSALLEALPDARLDIVVGGLRAGNTHVMSQGLKSTLRSHWRHVEEASGLPFSDAAMARAGFVYDTEPACRAVVTTRMLGPDFLPATALTTFHAIQQAFYEKGLDITQGEILAEVASAALSKTGFTISAETFYQRWAAAATIDVTRDDFSQAKRWGITGFPALMVERNSELHLIATGYTLTSTLLERLQARRLKWG